MSVHTKTATRSETSNSQSCNTNQQIEEKLNQEHLGENMKKNCGSFFNAPHGAFIEETELIFNEDQQKVIFSYLFHNTKQLINNISFIV